MHITNLPIRESASLILSAYLSKHGGREELIEKTKSAIKGKKRGRASVGASGGGKRARKGAEDENGHPLDSPAPVNAWKPPAGSWEDEIETLEACQDEQTGELIIYATWVGGNKTKHTTEQIYKNCPQKVCLVCSSDEAGADAVAMLT